LRTLFIKKLMLFLLFSIVLSQSEPKFVFVRGCQRPLLPYVAGGGYDLIKGNPRNQGRDPGYKVKNLFQLTYSNCETTTDQQWTIADQFVWNDVESDCNIDVAVTTAYNSHSYQKTAAFGLSISGSADTQAVRGSFTASDEFNRNHHTFGDENAVSVVAHKNCKAYSTAMSWRTASEKYLSQEYLMALVESYHWQDFSDFFLEYGTHFTVQTTLGGRIEQISNFETRSYQEVSSRSSTIDIGATVSFDGANGGLNMNSSRSWSESSYFNSSRYQVREIAVGGLTSQVDRPFDDITSYAKAIHQDPAPIGASLVPHKHLWTSTNVAPQLTELGIDLDLLTNYYMKSVETYCAGLKYNCTVPTERAGEPKPAFVDYSKASHSQAFGSYRDKKVGCISAPTDIYEDYGAGMRISKIIMHCGDKNQYGRVDFLQFELTDGVDIYTQPQLGGTAGTPYEIELSATDTIQSVKVYSHDDIVQMYFGVKRNNERQLVWEGCGGTTGTPSTYNIPSGYRLISYEGCHGYGKHGSGHWDVVKNITFNAYQLVYPGEQQLLLPQRKKY